MRSIFHVLLKKYFCKCLKKKKKTPTTDINGLMFSNESKMFLDEFNSIPGHWTIVWNLLAYDIFV